MGELDLLKVLRILVIGGSFCHVPPGFRILGVQALTKLTCGVGQLEDFTCVADLSWDHIRIQ